MRHKRVTTEATGAEQLKPRTYGVLKTIGFFFAACFWNGTISVFLLLLIEGYREGSPSCGLTIFMIPFVLVGIASAVAAAVAVAAIFIAKSNTPVPPDTVQSPVPAIEHPDEDGHEDFSLSPAVASIAWTN